LQDHRVAKRYALALFETARKYDIVSAVEADLGAFTGLIEKDPEFRFFFVAPYTSRQEKVAIVEKIFSDRITALTMQLIRVMLEKGREREIQGVSLEFANLRRAHDGIVHATVTSATELTAKQKSSLIARLEATQGKKFEADFEIDPRLMGGVKVAFGSYVLDGSVRGNLGKLRDQLRHDLLKQP
jgi:F-type H+-transporting ATPase subunit delta